MSPEYREALEQEALRELKTEEERKALRVTDYLSYRDEFLTLLLGCVEDEKKIGRHLSAVVFRKCNVLSSYQMRSYDLGKIKPYKEKKIENKKAAQPLAALYMRYLHLNYCP